MTGLIFLIFPKFSHFIFLGLGSVVSVFSLLLSSSFTSSLPLLIGLSATFEPVAAGVGLGVASKPGMLLPLLFPLLSLSLFSKLARRAKSIFEISIFGTGFTDGAGGGTSL